MLRHFKRLALSAAIAALAAGAAQAQLVPMLGAGAIQGGAAVNNPAPGLIQDARQTVGAYNQRSGLPLPGGPGALPIQGLSPAAAGSGTATAGYVVNGYSIDTCSSGMACLSQLRRAMGVSND